MYSHVHVIKLSRDILLCCLRHPFKFWGQDNNKKENHLYIRFWGVRGTIPTPGKDTIEVGGNTPCVEVRTSDDQLIIIDAGTGILPLGRHLLQENPGRITGNILISHTHWDHIQGFPFFAPIWGRTNRFILMGRKRVGQRLEEIVSGQFMEPYLPFAYKSLPADLIVKEVNDNETIFIGDKTGVRFAAMNHPGGCLGFRIENEHSVFAYCSDVGHEDDEFDRGVLQLAEGADLLVHDSHFSTIAERNMRRDWGHSTWLEAAQVAIEAHVKNLALFHFSPDMNDAAVEKIAKKARGIFPRTFIAREGLKINLPFSDELPE
ncbi:MAG: MBL fold metallo-hydrolase [Chloroflexi bacterium]|nr:MAG: MBL fold metallo-hydrolase [Chloroflexota bacterium]